MTATIFSAAAISTGRWSISCWPSLRPTARWWTAATPSPRGPPPRRRLAAEEAKIELTRAAEAPIFISGLDLGDERIDVDVMVTRAEYEPLIAPLIDRSLDICMRLLAAHGHGKDALARVVLVGGPTVTP